MYVVKLDNKYGRTPAARTLTPRQPLLLAGCGMGHSSLSHPLLEVK